MDVLLCYIILFFCPVCCANMDWPIGYGWQGTVWADRCLGQNCWAGLVLTGELDWMDPCSRASRGGGPTSRLNPGSETVMRGTMCQDWQNSSTTRYPHQYPVLLISSFHSFFCLSDTSHPLTKHFSPPFSLCSVPVLFCPPPSSTFCPHLISPSILFCLLPSYCNLCHWDTSVCMLVRVDVVKQTPHLPHRENLKSFLWK